MDATLNALGGIKIYRPSDGFKGGQREWLLMRWRVDDLARRAKIPKCI